jgi:pimeloyl-ACP methyl ester carboxylesterase
MQPTLMLLPGLMCDAAVWAPQVAALQSQAHCVVPAYGLRDSLTQMAQQAGAKERAGRLALLATARTQGMRAMARQWARGMVHASQIDTPLFESILDMLERSNPDQFAAQINALLNRLDAGALLPTIKCPTLVLCGREDTWATPAQHEAMHAAIPHSTLRIVEHCGHMCTMEQPQALSEALAVWLRA